MILTLIYPLIIWVGHQQVEPRVLAIVLILLALVRMPLLKINFSARWIVAILLLLALLTLKCNSLIPLQLYPVLINAFMFFIFAYSVIFPPSVIERIARLHEPNLPNTAILYTRRVTQVWCGFFVINGSIALATVLWGSPHIWLLYNGVIAYLLMGLLFGVEYLIRQKFKRQQHVK